MAEISTPSPSAIQELEQWISQSTSAHAALELLRERGDERLLFLRSIIELQKQPVIPSHMEEFLFHCILGCRHVLLGQWQQSYSLVFLHRVRDYLMLFGHAMQHRTIRLACYTTTAAFWKRTWTTNESGLNENHASHQHPLESVLLSEMSSLAASVALNSKEDLFSYINLLMVQGQQQHASELLECIVSEMGGKSLVVQYRMPLEFHKQAHKAFETEFGLYQSLQIALDALNQMELSNNSFTADSIMAILQLIHAILGWEFGTSAWSSFDSLTATTGSVIRPPAKWNILVGQVGIISAMFRLHDTVLSGSGNSSRVAQTIRQILMQLASLSGPVFQSPSEQNQFAAALCEGSLSLLRKVASGVVATEDSSLLMDVYQMLSRLVTNFRLPLLLQIATFPPLLQCGTEIGCALLMDHIRECESAGGDVDAMIHRDWREDVMSQLLECAVLISSDHWLWHGGGTEDSKYHVQKGLADIICPLYDGFVACRIRVAALEEQFYASNESDVDELREGITESELMEEIDSISSIGRLDLSRALGCLSTRCGTVIPQLQSVWETSGNVTPEVSALLEEARLLILYVSHLLTDGSEGESPSIPDVIMLAGLRHDSVVHDVVSAVQALLQIADAQVRKLVIDPNNPRLSPLLAKTLLNFLIRWAPAYIFPVDLDASLSSSLLVQEWSSIGQASKSVDFCLSLCLHYLCYWPQEPPVCESASTLFHVLARRGGSSRSCLVAAPSFLAIVRCHCLVAGIRLTIPPSEFEATVRSSVGFNASSPSITILWGYQRLPYRTKASLLTAILIACSDSNETANSILTETVQVIHDAFASLTAALATSLSAADDVHVREMACLCVDLLDGLAVASEMAASERIPVLLTPYLPQLSSLMTYYANDMTVCESLLRLFCDYTAHFISVLDTTQSRILFQSAAELLRSYSVHHWSSRVIKSKTEALAEEEQTYSDIICAIQLLINLGTKDFIDACSSSSSGNDSDVSSSQVTDMIFFGVQQILPLMTQGLLQYPKLCSLFFELVGFMCDTYPEQVCALPTELLDSLVESLLFGMRHVDETIGKLSLQGLATIAREPTVRPDLLDRCTQRLLSDVIYPVSIVNDRMEAAGRALLVLAAANVQRFAAVVQTVSQQLPPEQRTRLDLAYSQLLRPEVLAQASLVGYEGRMGRVAFKQAFERFVQDIHSFLVLQ